MKLRYVELCLILISDFFVACDSSHDTILAIDICILLSDILLHYTWRLVDLMWFPFKRASYHCKKAVIFPNATSNCRDSLQKHDVQNPHLRSFVRIPKCNVLQTLLEGLPAKARFGCRGCSPGHGICIQTVGNSLARAALICSWVSRVLLQQIVSN